MTDDPSTQAWWLGLAASGSDQALLAAREVQADGVPDTVPIVEPAPSGGLTSAQALERLALHGANVIRPARPRAALLQFLSRFRNPLVLILLVASAISAASGEIVNFFIIAGLVLASVTLDFVQEHRANRAAERLRESVSLRARVVRDGKTIEVLARFVVPGDILSLVAGDLVSADAVLLESHSLFVNQAMLTGESYPVEKTPDPPAAGKTAIQDASNAVFKGTSVVSGSARALVMRTGAATALGAIAGRLSQPAPVTAFETGTRQFGLMIMRITVLMVLFVLMVNLLFQRPWLESFLFAVALAVGLTPELLPMVTSVTLARGAIRMAREGLIVKRQSAIQDIGSMSVLCTDKTGTLTEAVVRVEEVCDATGQPSPRVRDLAVINSAFETGIKSPLDEALLADGRFDTSRWRKIDEVPFDFERRCVSVLVEHESERWLIVKGSPEDVLRRSASVQMRNSPQDQPIDPAMVQMIRDCYQEIEGRGLRALAVAVRRMDPGVVAISSADESGLSFAGFVSFVDPPKLSAAATLRHLQKSGVAIKIVTGDSDLVTRHVCARLDIAVVGVLTGNDIAGMDDAALRARAESVNLFCRVNPTQKERVIRALRARGHVVGYLGDGVNDAPSLHAADIGISVDSAVDVAREAADMILLRHDLGIIHRAVMEGRRTFGNVMKYIMMGTSSNFGNMFSMAGSSLFLPFLPMLPSQILLNNILYDVSETAIPFDHVDQTDMRYPRQIDLGFIRRFMLVIGLISSAFDFLTFFVLLFVLHAGEALFRTGWFVESLCTQVLVIFVIRTRGSPWATHPHPLLVTTSLMVVACALLLPFTPLGTYFGFVQPPAILYVIIAFLTLAYLLIVEAAKRIFYRRIANQPSSRTT